MRIGCVKQQVFTLNHLHYNYRTWWQMRVIYFKLQTIRWICYIKIGFCMYRDLLDGGTLLIVGEIHAFNHTWVVLMGDIIVPQPCVVAFRHEGMLLPRCNLDFFLRVYLRNPVTDVVHLEGAGASESWTPDWSFRWNKFLISMDDYNQRLCQHLTATLMFDSMPLINENSCFVSL